MPSPAEENANGTSSLEKKKKKKKNKDKKGEGAPPPAPTTTNATTVEETEKEKKKRLKKEKKAAAAAAAAAPTPMDVGNESNGAEHKEETSKKSKKSKKKKGEKRTLEVAPEVVNKKAKTEGSNDTAVIETTKNDKKKKSKKKKKQSGESGSSDANGGSVASPTSLIGALANGDFNIKGTHKGLHYYEHPEIEAMTSADVDAYREKLGFTVSGNNCNIKPIQHFYQAASSIPANILKVTANFKSPSIIQAQCWPPLLMGRDVIGIAKTGSGKTLGFMLPAYVHILHKLKTSPLQGKKGKCGPFVLVLAPTRELALQTSAVCDQMEEDTKIVTTCVFGGVDKWTQVNKLAAGVHVVIATPGRLLGLIKEERCSLKQVSYLVLDEADRMLDMGFEPDIRAIVGHMDNTGNVEGSMQNKNRQTLLFSATWPKEIQALGNEFVRDPLHVTVGSAELAANHAVEQIIEVMQDDRPFVKDKRLKELMRKYYDKKTRNKIIVFVLYKKDVGRVQNMLKGEGYEATQLSSDRSQAERMQALKSFKDNTMPVLVATDVAARGLDIPNVSHVINYSFPLTVEDYVHRIGRTGRGGSTGVSHTLFTKNDKSLAGELSNVLREAGVEVPKALMAFGMGVKKKEHGMYGAFYNKNAPTKKATRMTFN